jgi:hypothetical protein
MYQDSGVFLRHGAPSAFADRRAARRMDQGMAPPRAWRSAGGAVLRLAPERLAALAAHVKAMVPSTHPAAEDPHAAVLHRVALLARAARPAGTADDPATGRRVHLFRARGPWGDWEVVTAPPRGALFDILALRPVAGGEVQAGSSWEGEPAGVSADGARVAWTPVPLRTLAPGRLPPGEVYLLVKAPADHHPLLVGEAAEVRRRWPGWMHAMRLFAVDPAPYTLWVGHADPAHPSLGDEERSRSLREQVERALAAGAAPHLVSPPAAAPDAGRRLIRYSADVGATGVHARDLSAADAIFSLFVPPEVRWSQEWQGQRSVPPG